MRYRDFKRLERYSLKYNALLIRLCLNDEKVEKISMRIRRNDRGKLFTTFDFTLCDRKGHKRRERITANNEQYLWILTAAAADFPNVDFEDVSAPEFKHIHQPTEGVDAN